MSGYVRMINSAGFGTNSSELRLPSELGNSWWVSCSVGRPDTNHDFFFPGTDMVDLDTKQRWHLNLWSILYQISYKSAIKENLDPEKTKPPPKMRPFCY